MRLSLLRGSVAALVSAACGFIGTIWHRVQVTVGPVDPVPLGLILALGTMAAAMVALRAAWEMAGLVGAAVGALVATQLVGVSGPGGAVLIQADWLGYLWYFGAPAMVLLVAFLPRGWFKRT